MDFQFPRPFCHLRDVSLPGGLVEANEIEVLAKHKIVQIERRELVVTVQSIETYDQLTPAFFFADIFSWTTLLCLSVCLNLDFLESRDGLGNSTIVWKQNK